MKRSTAEIRKMFTDFFQQRGHALVESSSLIPENDPTLLFTNAGMNQFKDIFLGARRAPYPSATTAQRCLRAGGKHNDLENVGYTARHHTFFEMLGNFSFGSYGKAAAIRSAWELLTDTKWFTLPSEKLLVTVYHQDDEAYAIWTKEIGLPEEKVIRIGDNMGAPQASDNFWQMGDSGPCGPCTEIFYDHGPSLHGGPPGSAEGDGERYIEIWNIVFIQFNRQGGGHMEPLKKLFIDTGMGLERIAAVIQGVYSNYDTDLFRTLIAEVAAVTGSSELRSPSLQVISDHLRACSFLIAEGVVPSNEGRGYVLRRIIRRAVRHGQKLGVRTPFLHRLVDPLVEIMGDVAAPIREQGADIKQMLLAEEQQFMRSLTQGLKLLDGELSRLTGNRLAGEVAFKLYDTHGLPFDLTVEICRERNIDVDHHGFEEAMVEQQRRAQASSQFSLNQRIAIQIDAPTNFCGYEGEKLGAKIVGLWSGDRSVASMSVGEEGIVVLDETPFYAEAGGQVGDMGWITGPGFSFKVNDTQRHGVGIAHIGRLQEGEVAHGDRVLAQIDQARRGRIRCNHSATHLLHAALRQILGSQAMQRGSLVSDLHLRFDFSHGRPLTLTLRQQIETLVNQQIRHNLPIETKVVDVATAKSMGAAALFGEKYGEQVRLVSMGNFSLELCGGTHVTRTGEIGFFKITSEGGISAGIRRIEAVTGEEALLQMQREHEVLSQAETLLKGGGSRLLPRLEELLLRNQELEKKINHLNERMAGQIAVQLAADVVAIKGTMVLVQQLHGVEVKGLPVIVDQLKQRVGSVIVLLAVCDGERVNLAAGVTADLTARISANELVSLTIQQLGGKGGGRADRAQAAGSNPQNLPAALAMASDWIADRL